jgi:hypothetical protein
MLHEQRVEPASEAEDRTTTSKGRRGMNRVNVYYANGNWYFALWVNGEYDTNGEIDDAESLDDAIQWAERQWPDATIQDVTGQQ